MNFREAWARVGELEGASFTTGRGDAFTYTFKKTFVVIEPGRISVPRTNFEKVFREPGRERGRQPMQGERYIQAIFQDARFGGE